MNKVNLAQGFKAFSDHRRPKVAGNINDFQIKLAKLKGAFHWHHHDDEDELFLVVAGRLRMGLRDRAVELDAGEFIIVPRAWNICPRRSPTNAMSCSSKELDAEQFRSRRQLSN